MTTEEILAEVGASVCCALTDKALRARGESIYDGDRWVAEFERQCRFYGAAQARREPEPRALTYTEADQAVMEEWRGHPDWSLSELMGNLRVTRQDVYEGYWRGKA